MRNLLPTLALALLGAITAISLPPTADAGHYRHGHRFHGGHSLHGHGFHSPHSYYGVRSYGAYGSHYYSPYASHSYGPHYGGYYATRLSSSGAVRIEVSPKGSRDEIQVYVDGAHVGMADDFDGVFQRLHLTPGAYEIELRLEGYRTLRRKILISPERVYKIREPMEPLGPGDLAGFAD